MFCRNCGKEIQAGDKFCMTCGWRVSTEGETQPAEAQSAEVKPAETQPAEAQSAEVKPTEAQPAEAQPAEAQPTEAQSAEVKPAEAQSGQQSAAASPQAAAPVAPTKQEKPKKKKKGFFVAIGSVAVLAAAVIAVAFNWNSINHLMMRTFSSADKYYQYIEQENVDATIATAASAYNVLMLEPLSSVSEKYQSYLDGSLKGEDISFSGDVTLTLGELGQNMIKIASPDTYEKLDLGNLNSISAYYEISQSGDLMQMLFGIGLQGIRLISVDGVIDDGDDTIYMGLPELSEKYFSVKLADVIPEWDEYQNFAKTNMQEATAYLQILEEIAAKLPDEKQARKMMEKYGKIIIECLSDVEKKNGVNLKAGGVSQKCTRLDVTIDGKTLAKIAKKCCAELKDDKEFKKIFIGVLEELAEVYEMLDLEDYFYYEYGMLDIDAEKIYEAFRFGCETLADNADALKDIEFELVMSVYVDSKGQISGRSFEIEYNDVELELLIANPQDGKETGYKVETVVTMNGESGGAVIEGSYKESGGKLDGKFTMTVNAEDEEMDLWQLTVKQLNKAGLDKGYINGSFSMKLSEDLLRDIAPGYLVSKLAAMELCLDMSSSEDAAKCEIKLLEDGGLWASLVMSGKTEKGKKISTPSDVIQVKNFYDEDKLYEYLGRYWDSIDWKAFKTKLGEAGLPENLISGMDVLAECSLEDLLWMFFLTR